MLMGLTSKISSSVTDENDNNQVCFDTPVDSSNVLSVINKSRVKVIAKRRKPTRQGHVAAVVHSEKETKTFDSETSPTKSNINVFNENLHSSYSASTAKSTMKLESTKLDYESQEKNKRNLMSQVAFEATSKVVLKKSVEIEEKQQECEFDIVSETAKKDKSKNFSFQTPIKNVVASIFPVKEKENNLSISYSCEDNNVSKSKKIEATSKVILKKYVEIEECEFDLISENAKEDRSKNNFSFQTLEKNVVASVFPVIEKENNLSISYSCEDSNNSKSKKFVVAPNVVLEKTVEKEQDQDCENNIAREVVKKGKFKKNFSFLLPEENIADFAFSFGKSKENNLSECNSIEGSTISKSENFEVPSNVVLKKVFEKKEHDQNYEINISEAVKKGKSKNNSSFQPPEEIVIPSVFAIEKKDYINLPKSNNFEGCGISKSYNFENNDLSHCSFEDDFCAKSVSQISTTDLPDDVGFSTFFWHIFKRDKYTDVELHLESPNGPKIFSAHKMILSLWSPYFADKFYGVKNNTEAVNIIHFTDINPKAFETMLKFMYGYTPEFETYMKTFELYEVAAKFQVTSLIHLCCHIFNKIKILPSCVFDILEISEYMQNKSLANRCMKLIRDNTKEIMAAYKLSDISPSMIHIFLDSPKLSLDNEFDLLLWAFAWSKTRYLENSEYRSTREVLEQFLPKLNFLSLTNAEFAVLCTSQEAFFSQDEIVSIFMNIAVPGSMQMPNWYDKKHPFRIYCE